MRNLLDVIDEIRKVIPPERSRLLLGLDDILDNVLYTAPEAMGIRWNQLGAYMNVHFAPPLDEDWKVKAVSIFTTESEEKIREMYWIS